MKRIILMVFFALLNMGISAQIWQVHKKDGSIIEFPANEVKYVSVLSEEASEQQYNYYLKSELIKEEASNIIEPDLIYENTGWSIEYKGDIGDLTYVWRLDHIYGLRASAYKSSTYYPTDSWAISPPMNLKNATAPVFSFEQAEKYAESPITDYLQVWISLDYTGRGGLESATWTELTDYVIGDWPDGTSWDYYTMTLDMSRYVGNDNVVVAFRYYSTDIVSPTWEIKNVLCREPKTNLN